jgi:anti-anti-sigma factor
LPIEFLDIATNDFSTKGGKMSTELQISVSQMEGRVPVTVFHITGPLDANTSKDLESRATEAITSGTKNLLLDLAGVSYMASAGYRTLHKIYNMLHPGETLQHKTNGRHLKLLNPSPEASRIIKTLGFDAFLDVLTGDLRGAVQAFA